MHAALLAQSIVKPPSPFLGLHKNRSLSVWPELSIRLLRFVAASTAHLADPEEVCKFEIIFGGTSEPTRQNAHALVKAHYRALREALGDRVRLHWGQLIPEGTLDTPDVNGKLPVERSYPKFAQWRELRNGLDPSGRGLTGWLKTILP